MKINKENLELNSKGLNKQIKFHVLSTDQMAELGFWQTDEGWYKRERINKDTSFNVEIAVDKAGKVDQDKCDIAVLDENILQHYDWQEFLPNKAALGIQEWVENKMAELQAAGLISGHKKYDYI